MFKLQMRAPRSVTATGVPVQYLIRLCIIGPAFSVLIILNPACDAFAEDEPTTLIDRLEHLALHLRAAEKAVEKRLLSESLRVHFYG